MHGNCEDSVAGYICSCEDGYAGAQCEAERNECESNPCQKGGMCIDKFNDYRCKCIKGYAGNREQFCDLLVKLLLISIMK